MDNSNELNLGNVQETLLLPLWGRAIETQKAKPLLVDEKAVAIIKNLPYDFTTISKNISPVSRIAWIARSIYFDAKIKTFISSFPDATIVNIGCGLDTTFDRIDNGKILWIDLDLPDVINLRKKYISETERRHFIPKSVFDKSWYDGIANKKHVMFMIAGVLYYFNEGDIKNLFHEFLNNFPGVEIVFDYSSHKGVAIANKQVIEKGGMNKAAGLKWGIDDIYELEIWDKSIRVMSSMPMFKEYKKNYPLLKRIGMNISDFAKIMSLAHIKIG